MIGGARPVAERWARGGPPSLSCWACPRQACSLAAQKQLELISVERETAATRERADRYERMVEILGSQQHVIRTMAPAASQPEARAVVYLDASSGAGVLTAVLVASLRR